MITRSQQNNDEAVKGKMIILTTRQLFHALQECWKITREGNRNQKYASQRFNRYQK